VSSVLHVPLVARLVKLPLLTSVFLVSPVMLGLPLLLLLVHVLSVLPLLPPLVAQFVVPPRDHSSPPPPNGLPPSVLPPVPSFPTPLLLPTVSKMLPLVSSPLVTMVIYFPLLVIPMLVNVCPVSPPFLKLLTVPPVLVLPLPPLTSVPHAVPPPTLSRELPPSPSVMPIPTVLPSSPTSVNGVRSVTLLVPTESVLPVLVPPVLSHAPFPLLPVLEVLVVPMPRRLLQAVLSLLSLSPPSFLFWPLFSDLRSEINLF